VTKNIGGWAEEGQGRARPPLYWGGGGAKSYADMEKQSRGLDELREGFHVIGCVWDAPVEGK